MIKSVISVLQSKFYTQIKVKYLFCNSASERISCTLYRNIGVNAKLFTVLSPILDEKSRAKTCLLCVNRKLHATSTRKGVLQLFKKEKMGEDYINTENEQARTKK
jgi:hypothetical protein